MMSRAKKIGRFVLFAVLALALIAAAGAVWGALLYANLRLSPAVPWALPALALFLWLAWWYLGGGGWPAGTRDRRKALLRAKPVPYRAFAWSLVAGLLSIGAVAGLWIVLDRISPMPPNLLLPERFTSSPVVAAAIVLGASLLAPVIEESTVRGYLQSVLERDFRAVTAVALSSVVFVLAHVPQGLTASKTLCYFLVGVAFGTLAYLNDSILPILPVHMAADLIFFLCVWPRDAHRVALAESGADAWFWLHVAQVLACGGLALLAFRRLRAVSLPNGSQPNRPAQAPWRASAGSTRAARRDGIQQANAAVAARSTAIEP